MSRTPALLLLAALASWSGGAAAQEDLRNAPARARVYGPDLPCAAVQAAVARSGSAIVASSPTVYEKVYLDAGVCRNEVTSAPAFTRSADNPYCFAGYRCRDRNEVLPSR